MGETRNQRRSRRRRETKDDREFAQFQLLRNESIHLPKLVVRVLCGGDFARRDDCITGFIYNDIRFMNGSLIQTGRVQYVKTASFENRTVCIATTSRSTYSLEDGTEA